MLFALIVAALFAYGYAQSADCTNFFTSLASDPAASTCLAIQQLIALGTAAQNNASLVTPYTNWATSVCSQPACSTDTLKTVYNLLSTKCPPAQTWAIFSPSVFPTIRKDICLQKNGTLCITETLTNIEAYSGPITLGMLGDPNFASSYPTNISCTDCNKAAYNVIANDIPAAATSAKPALQSLCGAAFVDGQMPSGITQSANNATSTAITTLKSLAFSIFSQIPMLGLTAMTFIMISTMYTILV